MTTILKSHGKNHPFKCSNILAAPAYGELISQLIRYSRACGYYHDFLIEGSINTCSYWLCSSHHFECIMVVTMTWLTVTEYLCHKGPRICYACCKLFPVRPHPQRVPLVGHELLNLPEHMISPPIFSGVRVVRFSVFWLVFCTSLFVLVSIWPLRCMSFALWILITPLVSTDSSVYGGNKDESKDKIGKAPHLFFYLPFQIRGYNDTFC